jgi:hypothetical protein
METTSQQAFEQIVQKIQNSKSSHLWNYLVKNLVIVDACVNQRVCLAQFAPTDFQNIHNLQDPMAPFVRTFYSYLKSKLKLYLTYNFDNKQILNQHLDSLEITQLFTLLQDIQTTIDIIQQVKGLY